MDYKNRLKLAKEALDSGSYDKETIEYIFPELAESEDERIRKRLICGMNALKDQKKETFATIPIDDCIAWLEKQNGRKEYTFKSIPRLLEMIEPTERAKAYCQKLIDALIKEGYATDAKIVGECLKQMNGEKVALATMDEKQGEKKEINPTLQEKERMDDAFTKMMLKPQVDGFDAELNALLKKYEHLSKKELQEPLEFYLGVVRDDLDIVREKKPKWSEEDDYNIQCCIAKAESDIANGCQGRNKELIDWLKSLKKRMEE